jgi:hypothetical protein
LTRSKIQTAYIATSSETSTIICISVQHEDFARTMCVSHSWSGRLY